MNKPTMLKWCRKEKGMTQKALSEASGVSTGVIGELEVSSQRWDGLSDPIKEKLDKFFEGSKYWEPLMADSNTSDFENYFEAEPEEEPVMTKPTVVERKIIHKADCVEPNDIKAFTLIEFAYEGLQEAKTHEEFVANINMLKRIISKYY